METSTIPLNRLYGDLAYLWPLFSPPEEYAEEAGRWRELLRELAGPGRHRVLELGAGRGHNLSHLAGEFEATAVDLSPKMLALSKRLNPSVTHIAGDMRTVRLGEKFRAVLIHDAVSHLLTEEDLAMTFRAAAAHLDRGGILIVTPDYYRETFHPPRSEFTSHTDGKRRLTTLEYAHDPDPADTSIETVFVHLVEEGGRLRVELDRMVTGLFPKSTWRRRIGEAGFRFRKRSFQLKSSGAEYLMLIGIKQ